LGTCPLVSIFSYLVFCAVESSAHEHIRVVICHILTCPGFIISVCKFFDSVKTRCECGKPKICCSILLSLCAPLAMEQLLLLVSSFQSLHYGSLLGVLLGSTMH
jgi:hypothetical protein